MNINKKRKLTMEVSDRMLDVARNSAELTNADLQAAAEAVPLSIFTICERYHAIEDKYRALGP